MMWLCCVCAELCCLCYVVGLGIKALEVKKLGKCCVRYDRRCCVGSLMCKSVVSC